MKKMLITGVFTFFNILNLQF